MQFTLAVGCACAVLSLVFATAYPVATAHPMPQAPAASPLSDGASKIVAALRLRADSGRLCGDADGEAFHDAMRDVVIKLMMSGEIGGNPRRDAQSAADFFQAHCGQSVTASASAVERTPSPGLR
ncbi:MAG TPA: hypothetical protein VKR31_11260 [Rhizomicrobium sp.]|nr:hypothetical protein [Rhizomicrobium sp.]